MLRLESKKNYFFFPIILTFENFIDALYLFEEGSY